MTESAANQQRHELDAARRMSHGEQLARLARQHPDQVALVCGNREVAFAELDGRVNQLSRALSTRGVSRGDRVAFLMNNSIECVETIFAICRLGAVGVPLNLRLAPPELEYQLGDSGSTALVVDQAFAAVAGRLCSALDSIRTCLVLGNDPTEAGDQAESFAEAVDAESAAPFVVDVDEHAPAFILYTSGTTGRPKGAVLSHFSLMMSSLNAMVEQGINGSDEVWYLNLPLFHTSGLTGLFPYMMCGGRSVIVPLGAFDAGRAVNDLEHYGVTGVAFVSTQWQAICAQPDALDRTYALRRIIWGTSMALMPVLKEMARVFPGVPIYNFFGMTEMGVTCVLKGEDFERKMGSVGKPIINVETRIVDDDMNDVPVDTVGEIVFRGPTMLLEYWNAPDATAEAFRGGWFHSGDLCRMDADGCIYVVDRKKDMIISGGENIYSAEVENAILGHPGVREVAVIAAEHEKWGETPVAIIVPEDPSAPPDEAAVIAHVRAQLASYKKPSRVFVIDQLPRNATGKVVKPRLRERFGTPITQAGE